MGEVVKLPYRMGELLVGQFEGGARFNKEGKLKIGYSIDWDKTIELWHEDEEAARDKILVRHEGKIGFKAFLSKRSARF